MDEDKKNILKEFFEELFKDRTDKQISAFAYSIGKTLETAIRVRTGNIEAENQFHMSKIIEWRMYMIDSRFNIEVIAKYDEMFGIE